MTEKMEKTNMYLLVIVGIVAIVGIVVLILNASGGSVSYVSSSGCANLAGQAVAGFCTDSDGGTNVTVKGTVRNRTNTSTDRCYNQTTVIEFYCNATSIGSKRIPCKGGSVCVDGACKQILDSDGDSVPDSKDVCSGYDDTIDSDGDGIPDGCDLPDLVITGINFINVNGTSTLNAKDNSTYKGNVTINATVKNQGTGDVGMVSFYNSLTIEYTAVDGSSKTTKNSFEVSDWNARYWLDSGGNTTIKFVFDIDDAVVDEIAGGTPHDFIITMNADNYVYYSGYSNKVAESDETNNEYAQTVTITALDLKY